MALPWALAVLSLLPLLCAQSPECANFTAKPITNVTLDWLSGKWFYIASIFRHPEFNQTIKSIDSYFFYFAPQDGGQDIFQRVPRPLGTAAFTTALTFRSTRKNGTMVRKENDTEFHAHLLLSKSPRTFMLSFFPEDKQKMGIAIYSDKPQLSEEQLNEFHEVMECLGMHKSEMILTDEKKDQCGPLEKQHEEERKKEQEGAKEE